MIDNVPSLIASLCKTKKVLIITDDTVFKLYGEKLKNDLTKSGFSAFDFIFENGEKSKNIDTLSKILEYAAENNFTKSDCFIALGGGVVGDIAGLAAALYMRGVDIIQIPTTLLSAADSSIGGKTAVDLNGGKNLCGAFWQPSLVIIDTLILKNLPVDIFSEGLGEVIKCGVIKNSPIFDYIENNSVKENLKEILLFCLNLKKEIVLLDEFDNKGIRNILNVGHTAAHAIELLSDFSVSHGKAVALGLIIEAKISQNSGICDGKTVNTIKNAVKKAGLYFDFAFDKEKLTKAMLNDKKNKDSKIVFLLPENIGNLREVALTNEELISLL